MLNIKSMNERIREFLNAENKSSAQMAEEIDVQPSGISHILSGRNKPSLDFVLKMLERYKFLSNDWLLFGKGSMYKDNTQMLFDEKSGEDSESGIKKPDAEIERQELRSEDDNSIDSQKHYSIKTRNGTVEVEKIVWFYKNNSFEEYYPSR